MLVAAGREIVGDGTCRRLVCVERGERREEKERKNERMKEREGEGEGVREEEGRRGGRNPEGERMNYYE